MEIAALTSFLAPFLPHLLQAGGNLAEEAGRKLGGEAWEHAKRLWGRLRSSDEGDAVGAAAGDVAQRPGDERAIGALELQLEKLLAADPDLARELAALWEEAKGAGVVAAVGERSVAVGGDVSGTIVTGDQNTVG